MKTQLLVTCVLILSIMGTTLGDVKVTLNASGSTDEDGYIAQYTWSRYNEATDSVDIEGYITYDPNVPGFYSIYDKNNNFIELRDKPSIDVVLSVGVYYFLLIVKDNDDAVSSYSMDNRLLLDPADEWVTITVIPKPNSPPIILTEAQMLKFRDRFIERSFKYVQELTSKVKMLLVS